MEEYSKIRELKALLEHKKEIAERIEVLKTPILTDISHIKIIYSIYMDLLRRKSWSRSNVYHRNKFIFSVLHFYSPITLAGGSIEKGVRDEVAKVVRLKSSSAISNNIGEVVFSYSYYNDFREDVDYICSEVIDRLSI